MILTASPKPSMIAVSVITTCYGRNHHLYNLLSSLSQGSVKPAEVVIVNDETESEQLAQYPLNIVQLPTTTPLKTGFDIGHNRNVGAAHATYETLIFLDVDCIVAPIFIEHLTGKLQTQPNALLMGQPRYLTRPLIDTENTHLKQGTLSATHLDELSIYNPYRYNIDEKSETGLEQTEDYGAFWSVCFAISKTQFERIGGFDVHYVGYGAEDTDFAFTARELDIEFYLTNDVIYHQQHSVYRPPINHLASIVINANRFYDKWQHWPMSGWLTEFAQMQLIVWKSNQQQSITVIRQPTKDEIDTAYCPDAPYV